MASLQLHWHFREVTKEFYLSVLTVKTQKVWELLLFAKKLNALYLMNLVFLIFQLIHLLPPINLLTGITMPRKM